MLLVARDVADFAAQVGVKSPTTPRRPRASVTMWHDGAQRFGSFLCNDFDYFHHSKIFVVEDVTMQDKGPDVVRVLGIDVDLGLGRNQHGILPHELRLPRRILSNDLEWIDMDMEYVWQRRDSVVRRGIPDRTQ